MVGGNIATEVIPVSTADFFLTNRKEWLKYQKSQIDGADNDKSVEGFRSARASLLQGDYNKADKGIGKMPRAPMGQFEYTADLICCFFDRMPTIDVETDTVAKAEIGIGSGVERGLEQLTMKDEKMNNGIYSKELNTSQSEGNIYFDNERKINTENTKSDVGNKIGIKRKSKSKSKSKNGRKLQYNTQDQKTVKYSVGRTQRSERKIDSQSHTNDNYLKNFGKNTYDQLTESESNHPIVKSVELVNIEIGYFDLFHNVGNLGVNVGEKEDIRNQYENGVNRQIDNNEVRITIPVESENIMSEMTNISKESREEVEISYFNHKPTNIKTLSPKAKEEFDTIKYEKLNRNESEKDENDDQNGMKNNDDFKINNNRRKLKSHVGGGREKLINSYKKSINFPFSVTDYESNHEISFLDTKNAVSTTQHISVTRRAKV